MIGSWQKTEYARKKILIIANRPPSNLIQNNFQNNYTLITHYAKTHYRREEDGVYVYSTNFSPHFCF